jgi:hypothetical protein
MTEHKQQVDEQDLLDEEVFQLIEIAAQHLGVREAFLLRKVGTCLLRRAELLERVKEHRNDSQPERNQPN